MTEAQTSLQDSHAAESTPGYASGLAAGTDGENCSESGIDNGPELAGHTLLARPPAPQGRRSLFRR
jgi:hypothetical protein